MAVAFDAKTATWTVLGTSGTTLTISNLTVGAGANRALLCGIWFDTGSIPTGITAVWDSGGTNQSMTAITGATITTDAGTTATGLMFGRIAPTSGNKNLVVSWTGSASAGAFAVSYTGVDQTSVAVAFPHGTSAPGNSAGPASVTVTSATGNITVAMHVQGFATWGTISGTTIATDTSGPVNGWAANYAAGAATVTLTAAFSGGTGHWDSIGSDILASTGTATIFVQPWLDSKRPANLFDAAKQQFSAFQPMGNVPVAGKPGWSSFFDRGFPPPTAAQQVAHAFTPRGSIASVTPVQYGGADFFDSSLLTGTEFPSSTNFSSAQQQWGAFQPRGTVISVTPQGGIPEFFDSNPYTSPYFPSTTAMNASRQQWDAFRPPGTIVSTTPQGWTKFFDASAIKLKVLGEAMVPYPPIIPVLYGLAQGFDQNDSSWIPPLNPAKHPFPAFQPRGTISAGGIQPQGTSDFFDSNLFTATDLPSSTQFSVALQQWTDFVPRGTITSITPEGWSYFFDSNVYTGYEFPSSTQFPSASQQWNAFTPRGAITSITPQGWWGFFDNGPAPASAARQRWDAFQPQSVIVSITPQGWWGFYDSGPAPATAARQRFDMFEPRGAIVSVTPQGWTTFYDSGRAPSSAAMQQFDATRRLTAPVAAVASTWGWSAFFDASRIRIAVNGEPMLPPPLGTLSFAAIGFDANDMSWVKLRDPGRHAFSALTPRGAIVSITPQGFSSFFDTSWVPSTEPGLHPFSALAPFQPVPGAVTTGPLGWARFYDSGPRPPTAALQQWAAYPIRFVVSITPQGFTNFFDAGPTPATASRQPFAAFQPRGNVPLPPQPNGWTSFFDRGQAPTTSSRQQWAAFQPRGLIVSITPQGWARFFNSGNAPPSAARQRWEAFQPRGNVPLPPLPNGWTTFYDAGRAPSTASRQPWSFFQPQGRIVSITPQGFSNFYDAGPPAPTSARQQWGAFQPLGFIIPPLSTGTWGWPAFYDSISDPLKAALQQFDAWSPVGSVAPPPPPPITMIGCVVMGRACDCGEPHHRFTLFPGATWQIQGNLHYADGTPFNLASGCQIMWAMEDAAGNRPIMLTLGNGITVIDAAQGKCLLLIPRAVSLTVPLGSYTDQLRAIDPTGYVSDQWTGPITVAESFFN